jgi:hypothetical protein
LIQWFKNLQKTGGGRIVESQFLPVKKILIITYENEIVAERVVKFGEIEIRNQKYKAKCFSRISVNDLSFTDIQVILTKNSVKFDSSEKLGELLSKLPRDQYIYVNDWLGAFSIPEIKQNFSQQIYYLSNDYDLFSTVLKKLKEDISKSYFMSSVCIILLIKITFIFS